MPSSLVDVCRFNPTAGGITDWTFSSAVTGYQSPSAAGAVNGAQYSYRAESADLTQWEIGVGVYNSSTGVLTRATVLFSSAALNAKVNFSVVPQVALVALAEDLVRSIGGVAGALTVGKGIAIVGSDIERSLTEAITIGAPANPATTTSTTGVMMGLGSTAKITPVFSGRVKIEITLAAAVTVATASATLQVRYGTGTAPTNGAALTGTALGSAITGWSDVASSPTPFALIVAVTGLTPGTPYWFDVSFSVSTGTGSLTGVNYVITEF